MNSSTTSSDLPLQGVRILITRAREQAAALADPLKKLGAEVLSIPTIEIRPPQSYQPLDRALKKIQSYDWMVLTSANGVEALARRMEKSGMDAGLLRHLSIVTIGPATRREAEALGLKVKMTPPEYVAESVVAVLSPLVANKKVLLVRAKVARDVIPQQLAKAGAEVDVVEAYQTALPVNSRERLWQSLQGESRPNYITFTSSSTVKNFVALLPRNVSPKELLAGVRLVSIGPVTSESLRQAGLPPSLEASEYTMEGIVAAIAEAQKQDAAKREKDAGEKAEA